MICRWCGKDDGAQLASAWRCNACGQFTEVAQAPPPMYQQPPQPPPVVRVKQETSPLAWVGAILLFITFVVAAATGQC